MCPESAEARERRLMRSREWKRKHAGKHALNVANYRKRFPEKQKAQNAVSYALHAGKLTKGLCSSCGTDQDICAHHEDYTKPLDVTWLCRPCHIRHHSPNLQRGRRTGNPSVSKLNEDSVTRIRDLLATGLLTNRQISMLFGVTPENISAIRDGKTWRHIQTDLLISKGRRGGPSLSPETIENVHKFAVNGYTQAGISRELDISTASVSRILHGRKP